MDKRYPLGLPPGSVRAIGFLALLGAVIFNQGGEIVEELALVAGGLYFGSRIGKDESV